MAAGYLTAYALLAVARPEFTSSQTNLFLWLGLVIAFSPDIDSFFIFIKNKAFTFNSEKYNHRKLITHSPFLWLTAGLAVYFSASDPFIKYVGLLIWLATWSHFLLDSLQYGIMWFWPFSSKVYAFKDREVKLEVNKKDFFSYWIGFLNAYWQKAKLTFFTEIVLIVFALVVVILRR